MMMAVMIGMLIMVITFPFTCNAATMVGGWDQPLDTTTPVYNTSELEWQFPKYSYTLHLNTTTNETYLEYDTDYMNWCVNDTVMTVSTNNIPNGLYSRRTGYPPVCVLLWAQLRNNITFNSTTLLNPTDYPNFQIWKMIFYARVDQFSLLELYQSNHYFVVSHIAIQIPGLPRSNWVMLQNLSTDADTSTGSYYVVPFVTAIIQLNGGVPTAVTWDTGCDVCGGEATGCVDGNFCGQPSGTYDNPCYGGYDATVCTLDNFSVKIYLGWFGTDANHKYCTSADKRFSQFRKYSLHSAYESAASTLGSTTPAFPSWGDRY